MRTAGSQAPRNHVRVQRLVCAIGPRWWRRVFAAGLVAMTMAASACNPSEPSTAPDSRAQKTPAEPTIPQAHWKIVAHGTGGFGKLSKKQTRRLKEQKPRVRKLVREIYAALFLEPDALQTVLTTTFTRRAGRALKRSGAGFRPEAHEVRTVARKATIGIQARTASLAAARVKVRAKAMSGNDVVKVRHLSTLWLQRKNGRWRVIGFRVDQERVA